MAALCCEANAIGERPVCNSELNQSNSVLTLCTINLRTTRPRFPRDTDKRKRCPANHKQCHKSRNAHCTTNCRRQLLRRLCETTFAVTTNARPEHTLLAGQNRCLQGFCKCSGAGISHFVVAEPQCGEGGIRLVIFHSTDASAQVAACVVLHTHHCTSAVKVLSAKKFV